MVDYANNTMDKDQDLKTKRKLISERNEIKYSLIIGTWGSILTTGRLDDDCNNCVVLEQIEEKNATFFAKSEKIQNHCKHFS